MVLTVLALLFGLVLASASLAANTEPTLALMRATAVRGSSGRVTLTLDASFSFADAVQLGLPVEVLVTQGTRTAHCSLSGDVSVAVDAGPPQPAPPPCVIGVAERTLTLVLPAEFGPGAATAQLVLTQEGRVIASNHLGFTI